MRRRVVWRLAIVLSLFFCFAVPHCLAAGDTESSKGPEMSTPQNQPQPHPGRDAPLWEKGGRLRMDQMPPIRKISDGVIVIDKIKIDKRIPMITVPGVVNMQDGLVEYLACGPRGKLHESVLRIDAEPFYLQIAMLLIGLEPGQKPLSRQGEAAMPDGGPVQIEVQWIDSDNKRVTLRAEDVVFNQNTQKSMQHTTWVFTGSKILNGRFMAQVEHSIAAIYHDPFALLDHQLPTGSDDRLYYANKKVLPGKGTPIVMIIKPKGPTS